MSGVPAPFVRVLRGEPSAEELAAALVVLGLLVGEVARRAADEREAYAGRRGQRTDWQQRCPGPRGPGVWRDSGWRESGWR
ncbi:acyl-CoA carboxylase subunit epsilon [Streptomyces sp. NPDC047315]|uniref:acyl-CoA carboxylase subunit epsilon n=1 Tax=Streptomyces sp. NPDC047315 TaxID=3155142 RepID=UPI0034063E2C